MNNLSISTLRQALGISIIWISSPLIFFLRSVFGSSLGTLFTGGFYIVGLMLMFSELNYKKFYKGNILLSYIGFSFYILGIFYFLLYNMEVTSLKLDLLNYVLTILFIIFIFRISNDVQLYLPIFILFFTIITNLALCYSLITNVNYYIGMRATVQFSGTSSNDYSGNPHVYGRNAVAGVIISFLFIFNKIKNISGSRSTIIHLIAHINLVFSFIILLITQTRANFISLILSFIFYFLFSNKSKLRDAKTSSHRVILFYYTLVGAGIIYFNFKYKIIDTVIKYYDQMISVVLNAVNTGLTMGSGENRDASALGRVGNIQGFKNELEIYPINFILGNGYKYRYLDVPILEAFMNFGIIGLLLFALLNVGFLYYSAKAINSSQLFQVFLGMFYFNSFITIFTAGRPLDLSFWVPFIIMIRFLTIYSDDSIEKN